MLNDVSVFPFIFLQQTPVYKLKAYIFQSVVCTITKQELTTHQIRLESRSTIHQDLSETLTVSVSSDYLSTGRAKRVVFIFERIDFIWVHFLFNGM